jgi:hypothetical protein
LHRYVYRNPMTPAVLDSGLWLCHHRRIHPLINAGQIIANTIAQSETALLDILTDDLWQSRCTCRRSNRLSEDGASLQSRVLLCAAAASVRCSEGHIPRAKTVTARTFLGSLASQLPLIRGNSAVCERKSKNEAAQ